MGKARDGGSGWFFLRSLRSAVSSLRRDLESPGGQSEGVEGVFQGCQAQGGSRQGRKLWNLWISSSDVPFFFLGLGG